MHTRVCMSFYYICTVKYLDSIWDMQDVHHGLQITNLIIYIFFIFHAIWRHPAYTRLNLNIAL